MIISPSLFNIELYILIIPLDIELIRNIETIEKIKLSKIRVVFKRFAFNARIAFYNIDKYFLIYLYINTLIWTIYEYFDIKKPHINVRFLIL